MDISKKRAQKASSTTRQTQTENFVSTKVLGHDCDTLSQEKGDTKCMSLLSHTQQKLALQKFVNFSPIIEIY